ncbi:hypothetical protein N9A28_03095 [Sulfurimonas sp.]|nr:hypothetical protein [Sulfurimonas sp.]
MVKPFFLFLLLVSSVFSNEIAQETNDNELFEKIKTFVEPKVFVKDRGFIDTIFSPTKDYYLDEGKVDTIKVIKNLKNNGILNLFFDKPREVNISFKTSGNSQFFVKIMSDTLQNIGYYRYVTTESILDASGFIWRIALTSEYAADPLILSQELQKSNCVITDVIRHSPTDWTYVIQMQDAKLNTSVLMDGMEYELKRSLYSYWLDVSKIKKLKITSSYRNSWYPYIAYYDKSMKLLRVIRRDIKRRVITLDMKQDTHYLKISDIYTLKNIKDALVLTPIGVRDTNASQ